MAEDINERPFIPIKEGGITLSPGQQKNIGSIPCKQMRTISATVRGSYAQGADTTKPLCLKAFYSPDGRHHDTNSFASIFLPATQGATKQITRRIDPPETGFLAIKISNPDANAVTDVSVWMGGRRWADSTTKQA